MKKILIWLDLETTGLDPEKCSILEIAAVATMATPELTELARFETLVPGWMNLGGDPVAMKMNAKLLGELKVSPRTDPRMAGGAFIRFTDWLVGVRAAHPEADLHLAGNSVHFDRAFLKKHIPFAEAFFHHRHLDVSSLTMTCDVFYIEREQPQPAHRAMADVRASMDQWREAVDLLMCTCGKAAGLTEALEVGDESR